MSDVTRLLDAANRGDRQAAAELLPLVYDELRKLAAAKMAQEKPGHTLEATALVHEAYLRLTGNRSYESQSHFLRVAAKSMRRILVDHARARDAAKRGGGKRVEFESEQLAISPAESDLAALDDALCRLAIDYPQQAEPVQLRFFGGASARQAHRPWESPTARPTTGGPMPEPDLRSSYARPRRLEQMLENEEVERSPQNLDVTL